jgi:hypothetical protein
MEAPRRYSVSPYYSFVTVPTVRRQPSFAEMVMMVWRWFSGRQKPPSKSEIQSSQPSTADLCDDRSGV